MTTQSNGCGCQSCDGPGCACGCRQINGRRYAAGQNAVCIGGSARTRRTRRIACGRANSGLRDGDPDRRRSRRGASATVNNYVRPHEAERLGRKPGERSVDAYTGLFSEPETKSYLVTVRMNDRVYVGRSGGDWFWEFDPTRLVINDPIDACVEGHAASAET